MNKKGFTLIELLAVIVLLAIVGVVGSNIIIKRVNKAKKDTFIQTYNDIKSELATMVAMNEDVCLSDGAGVYRINGSGDTCNLYDFFDIQKGDYVLKLENRDTQYQIYLKPNETGTYKNVTFTNDDDARIRTKASVCCGIYCYGQGSKIDTNAKCNILWGYIKK